MSRLKHPSFTWFNLQLTSFLSISQQRELVACRPLTWDNSPCSSATDASLARLRFTFEICNNFVLGWSVSHYSRPTFDIIISLSLSVQKNWLREHFVPLKWENKPLLRAPCTRLRFAFWDCSFAKAWTRVSHSSQPTVGIIISLSLSLLRRIRCRRKLHNKGHSHDAFPLGPQLGAHGWRGGSEVVVWPRVRIPGVFSFPVQCHHALQLDHPTRHRACELIFNFQPITGSFVSKYEKKLATLPADSASQNAQINESCKSWVSDGVPTEESSVACKLRD